MIKTKIEIIINQYNLLISKQLHFIMKYSFKYFNITSIKYSKILLFYVYENGNETIVKYLVKCGADYY